MFKMEGKYVRGNKINQESHREKGKKIEWMF